MRWPLLSVEDLELDDVDIIFAQADAYRADPRSQPRFDAGIVALVFFDASLRTRAGFHAAAARLGATAIEVQGSRSSELSSSESWADTLRVVAGYVDVIVGRSAADLNELDVCDKPFLSGGDRGALPEHPTQALIDRYAIRRLVKRHDLHLVIVGDPGMRSARSLIRLSRRIGTTRISVVSHPTFLSAAADLENHVDVVPTVPADADVLYVTGMHHASLDLVDRESLIVTGDTMSSLPAHAVVLSPMPVIDEIDEAARRDRRLRMFKQSDDALYVRMALLATAFEAGLSRRLESPPGGR